MSLVPLFLGLHLVGQEVGSSGFGSLWILVLPLVAVGLIALGVYLLRTRHGRKRT